MKILSVQDISCYGQCSLTVALPILSAYGIETVILPSAVLSTHTGGFTNFVVHDLTDEMPKIIKHWIEEGIKFDAIYTGYIGNAVQFDYILEIIDKLLVPNGKVFIDPAMADHGKMYYGLGEEIVEGMRKLCAKADYILPNITEACYLTNTEYSDKQDDNYIKLLLEKCKTLGTKNVILTGVEKNGEIGASCYDGIKTVTVLKKKISKSYHGTGDIFSSIAIANLLNGNDVEKALEESTSFVCDSINNTLDDNAHNYGVKFEKTLFDKIK